MAVFYTSKLGVFIMMKLKNIVLVLSSTFAVATANAGGIPVVDASAIAQDAANFVKQLAEMKTQVENQIKQITELKNQVAALTGGRELGNLAREAIGEAIPDSWKDIYSDVKNVDLGRLSEKIDRKKEDQGLIVMINNTEKAFDDIKQRMAVIEQLTNAINSTTDIKAATDLNARIAAEQTAISNQQVKLDQIERMYNLEKELAEKKRTKRDRCILQNIAKSTNNSCE